MNVNPAKTNYYPDRFNLKDWLPVSKKEVEMRGWEQPDIILFTGDAYVDHPAFGAAVIGRVLEREGFRVALVPQPNWRDDLRDFTKLGLPRLFFGITAGNMDSMINHYTANRRLRSDDAYTPGGKAGFRPDRAVLVYARILRRLFPESIVVAGGIEASLRRLMHFDYWDDEPKPGLLDDPAIDYIVYGNGEKTIIELARVLDSGDGMVEIAQIPQLAWRTGKGKDLPEWPGRTTIRLHSFEESLADTKKYAFNFRQIEEESNKLLTSRLIQEHNDYQTVVNPPWPPASTAEMDSWAGLPYTRLPHPRYWDKPLIPAFEMIRFSVNIHRGCFGGCSFCTISAHQGKHVSSRSEESILAEILKISQMPGFRGYLSDLGGPSANMYRMEPVNREICLKCRRPSCIHPGLCPNINISHKHLIILYRKVRQMPGIKKAFIGSGIRYDLFLNDRKTNDGSLTEYPEELIRHHVSGRLKVAPEHTEAHVLHFMRKPGFDKYLEFCRLFDKVNDKYQMGQEIVPYFISSHPECRIEDMAELAVKVRNSGLRPEPVQDFTPTPLTLSTTVFHTGLDPYKLKPVYVAKKPEDKLAQKQIFFWHQPGAKMQIIGYLNRIGRKDLIRRIFPVKELKHVKEGPGKKRKR